MKRIDWHLFRPLKIESSDAQEIVDTMLSCLQDTHRFGGDADTDATLAKTEPRYQTLTVSPCEAAHAPLIGDDPDWETRTIEEFAEVDTDLELEEYLDLRRTDSDCERCPYANPYSLFPMAPCEYSAGGLASILVEPRLAARASEIMLPEDMIAYADALDRAIEEGQIREHQGVHAEDYVSKAVLFLRFWAKHRFTIVPVTWPEADLLAAAPPVDEPDQALEHHRMLH